LLPVLRTCSAACSTPPSCSCYFLTPHTTHHGSNALSLPSTTRHPSHQCPRQPRKPRWGTRHFQSQKKPNTTKHQTPTLPRTNPSPHPDNPHENKQADNAMTAFTTNALLVTVALVVSLSPASAAAASQPMLSPIECSDGVGVYLQYLARLGQVEEFSCSGCSDDLAAHVRYQWYLAQLETVKELDCTGPAVNSDIPSYLTYFAGLTNI
jgi:hypothetical protein